MGLASLTLPAITALNVLVFAIACAFVAVSAMGYAFHRGRSCRCFGALSQRKFDAAGVLRSAVIAGIAAVALAHVGAAALQLDATARALLSAAAGLLAVAAFTAARARGAGSEAETGGGDNEDPLYLAVAQWTLLFAFGLLLIVVFRQLGRTLHKDDTAAPLGPRWAVRRQAWNTAGSPTTPCSTSRQETGSRPCSRLSSRPARPARNSSSRSGPPSTLASSAACGYCCSLPARRVT